MPERISKLKEEEKRILKALPSLLKRDVWFRREMSVILSETLATKDELRQVLEEIRVSREETNRRFEAMDKRFEEIDKRFEAMDKRFEKMDKRFEAMDKRFEKMDKRFEAMDKRFEAMDKRFEKVDKRFEEMDRRFASLVQEMHKGFELQSKATRDLGIKVDTIGARWGILAESTIRNTLRELLLKELKVKEVKEWKASDKDGFVFGYPGEVQIDLLLKNREEYVVEIKSSASSGDVTLLYRKAKFYAQITGTSPKMVFVSVDMNNEGRLSCQELNIQLITYDDLKD